MRVPYNYLQEQFADARAILADIEKLLSTTEFTLGPPVAQFEAQFAKLCGTKYAVGVGTGTDALFLSLKALGIGPGDEVITNPNTFIATVGAIVASGAKPIFVDAGSDFNIDPTKIEDAITPNTRAIMPVHYAGNPARLAEILAIAQKHQLKVVEDACQAIGGSIHGKPVGSFGDAAGFSLHPLKNLNVWGDAGVVVTNSEEVYHNLLLLRNHGMKNRDEIACFGYNSRLDTLQAIVGNHMIGQVDWINQQRIAHAQTYDAAFADLTDVIKTPVIHPNTRHVYHLYMLQVADRDRLYKYLNQQEIEAKIHYPIPLHLQEASRHLGYGPGDFPVAEKQCQTILSLPVHQHLSQSQIDYTLSTVRKFYK